MTSTAEVRDAFATISNTLAAAVTAAHGTDDPLGVLIAHIDQVRGFIDGMAKTVSVEPETTTQPASVGLSCSACIQDARNSEAAGQTARPILPAATIINGLALCDVEGRHRIVTAVQHAVAQRSGILLPGQNNGPTPGGTRG